MSDNKEVPFLATEDALEILKKLKKFMGEWMVKNPHITQIEDKLTHDFLFAVLEKLIEEQVGFWYVINCGNSGREVNVGWDCNRFKCFVPTLIESLARCLSECVDYLEANDDKVPS
jgi:hypothetical protein